MHIVLKSAAFLLGGVISYAEWVEYNAASRFEVLLFLFGPAILTGILLRSLIAVLLS